MMALITCTLSKALPSFYDILQYDLDNYNDSIFQASRNLVHKSKVYILQSFAGVDPFVKPKLVHVS